MDATGRDAEACFVSTSTSTDRNSYPKDKIHPPVPGVEDKCRPTDPPVTSRRNEIVPVQSNKAASYGVDETVSSNRHLR